MDVVNSTYLPGDPRLIQQLVYELKSQGIFDQFRKECIADVDTKPAYQNLRQRVEGSVTSFLKQQTWKSDMNKNQVREQLRKNIYESGYLETGVERIVDQVVNPKINTVFLPQVEEVVYRYLGIQRPNRTETKKELKIDLSDLLPTDLEAVSPESDHLNDPIDKKDYDSNLDISSNYNYKIEEDESPAFEPLEVEQTLVQEENSVDSHLSGFSGLHSHDSNPSNNDTKNVELSNQDSQVSHNSSESHLSIITSEENTKMEICEDSDFKLVKSTELDSRMDISVVTPINYEQDVVQKEVEEKYDKMEQNKKDDQSKKPDQKKFVEDIRKCEKHSEDKKNEEKRNENKKHEKRENDKKGRNSEKHGSKDRKDGKKDDKHRKSSNNNSKDKEKLATTHTSTPSSKDKDKIDKSKSKKDIKSSSNTKGKDKCEKEKEKHEKSDKEKPDKDKEKNDKDKSKSSSSNSSRHSSNCTKDKEKNSSMKRESSSKEKEKSRSSSSSTSRDGKSKSSHSDSKKSSGDKHKKSDKSLHNDKSSSGSTNSKKDKDRKREPKKDLKDDHYSAKEKKNHRRSTDRDSNDGQPSRHSESNSLVASSSYPQKSNQDMSNMNNGSGSGDSGNSDKSEQSSVKSPTKLAESIENMEITISCSDLQKFKYSKPKFASNFQEARKLMKIRKQLAKLEKQNQLSLVHIEVPTEQIPSENGIASEQIQIIDEVDKMESETKKITGKEEIVYSNVDGFINKLSTPEAPQNDDVSVKLDNYIKEQVTPEQTNISISKVDTHVKEQNSPEGKEISSSEVDSLISESNTPEIKETVHLKADSINKGEKTPEDKGIISPNVITPLLQSTDLSKESWEALEARLAQEMSNVNYNSYESPYDDYDCAAYNSIIISPKKKKTIEKHEITDQKLVATGKDEKPKPNNTSCKIRSNVSIDENIGDAYKNVNCNIKDNFNEHHLTIEIKEFVNKEQLENKEETCTPQIVECIQKCVEGKESEPTINMVKNDKRITKNLQIILKNEGIKNTLDVDDQCRYLEKPSPGVDRHLEFIYEYIGRLEQEIASLRKPAQNNCLPSKRGRKRKLEENVDLKNNNKAVYEQSADTKKRGRSVAPNLDSVTSKANKERMCNSTDISPNNSFSLPLSPAESDKSNDKKEESPKSAKQKRNIISKNANSRSQRYSSDDLYKPRPTFATTRRSRGAKNLDS